VRLLLAATVLAVSACQGSSPPAPPAPTTLTVTEEVVDADGASHREVTDVDLPYRARLRVYSGSQVTGGFVWTETALFTLKDTGPQRTQDVLPGRPGPVSNLDVALPVALAQGLVRRQGTDTVLGRPCTWWLSRLPLSAGPPALPAGGDEARSCVDETGLVLSSTERSSGRLLATRTVVSISRTASLTDRELFGGTPPSGGTGLVMVQALTSPAAPPLAVIAQPPAGWAYSRAAVAATLADVGGEVRLSSDRAVYVRDGRLAVLDETQDRLGPPVLDRGSVVQVGGRSARLTAGFDGLTLRFLAGDGVLVTLTGALTRDEIVAWGASLRDR
jgi:hypothetical protein